MLLAPAPLAPQSQGHLQGQVQQQQQHVLRLVQLGWQQQACWLAQRRPPAQLVLPQRRGLQPVLLLVLLLVLMPLGVLHHLRVEAAWKQPLHACHPHAVVAWMLALWLQMLSLMLVQQHLRTHQRQCQGPPLLLLMGTWALGRWRLSCQVLLWRGDCGLLACLCVGWCLLLLSQDGRLWRVGWCGLQPAHTAADCLCRWQSRQCVAGGGRV